jgi:hypothetical protein
VVEKYISRAVALAIFVYYWFFARGALSAFFAPDDPFNIGVYWRRGLLASLWDNVKFWNSAYRPMGALFYLPLYDAFGLNPLPYRIAILALIAVNIYLSYRVVELVTKSQPVAALTAVLVTAHASMVALYYYTSLIYDVMAYFFTLLMLFVYIRVRSSGRELTWMQSVAVALLCVAGLNSKEIAAVGAGWLLAYELLFQRPWKLRLPIALIAITLVSAAGKVLGPNALAKQGGYLLDLSLHRYFVNNEIYVSEFFYSEYFTTSRKLLIAWAILTIVCAVARKRELWWAWFLVSTVTLPVSFTIQHRNGPSLYLPLFAFALMISLLAVGFFKPPALAWAAAGLVAILCAQQTVHYWRERTADYIDFQRPTWSAITQVRDLGSRPPPHSRVLFLKDPFRDWDTYFIAELVWNDHSLDIRLADKLGAPPQFDDYDWILTFEGQNLRIVRAR